jgi:hypothetical protein
MENKPALSIRELTEIIRNCQSAPEIERFISNIRTEFDSHSISDQAFLLALIGVTLMTITATPDPLNYHISEMHLSRLLGVMNWREKDNLN